MALFERKEKEDTAKYKRQLEKWESSISDSETRNDLSHRRFNVTLQPTQILKAFKECIYLHEYKQDDLITCYRVILAKLLQDPHLSDKDFISMYKQIQPRAEEVYKRRADRLKGYK